MESTCELNRIQASQKTADLLIAVGKESWVSKRTDVVNVKGKGPAITYWVEPGACFGAEIYHVPTIDYLKNGLQHLINFNVEVLENF